VIFQLPCYISAILDFDEALPTIAGSGDVPGDAASTGIPSQSDALKPERWAEPESRPLAGRPLSDACVARNRSVRGEACGRGRASCRS